MLSRLWTCGRADWAHSSGPRATGIGGSGCSGCSGGCAHAGTAFSSAITVGFTRNSRTHELLTVSRSAGSGTVCNVSSAFLPAPLPWLFGLLPRPTPAAARSALAALFASIFASCFSLRMVFRGAPAYRSTQAKRACEMVAQALRREGSKWQTTHRHAFGTLGLGLLGRPHCICTVLIEYRLLLSKRSDRRCARRERTDAARLLLRAWRLRVEKIRAWNGFARLLTS